MPRFAVLLSDQMENLDCFHCYSLEEDNNDSVRVLVCTMDLASHGIDVSGVAAIIQLQFLLNSQCQLSMPIAMVFSSWTLKTQ